MANIDWGCVTLGALIGVGCRKQLKAASRIATNTAASLASAAASAVAEVAKETQKTEKSPEIEASEALFRRIDQHIAEQFDEYTAPKGNGNGNGQ